MTAPEAARSPVLVIGEALVDVVDRLDGITDEHPGGSPLNVAVGLARLGHDVTLLTQLGDDRHGDLVRNHIVAAGVRLQEPAPTSATALARATITPDGSADYSFDIAWTLEGADYIGPAPMHVHTGSLGCAIAPGADRVEAMLNEARASASTSYDPNIRPALEPDRAAAVARVERFVALADVVKASDEDVAWLYPDVSPDAVIRKWVEAGPAIVVVTTGDQGAVAGTMSGPLLRSPALPVNVADTVGAGDSFMSALLDGLARSEMLGASRRAWLRAIEADVLLDALGWAARAAAITVSRPGADPPTTTELLRSAHGHADDSAAGHDHPSMTAPSLSEAIPASPIAPKGPRL